MEDLSLERGHRTVMVLGKGSKLAVIRGRSLAKDRPSRWPVTL